MTLITSRQNPVVKKLRQLGADPALRREDGVYLCDGRKLLEDALRSGVPILTVLAAEGIPLPPLPENTELIRCSDTVLQAVSPSRTPQGVVFCTPIPAPLPSPPKTGRYLLLEGLQDPGNVGSILRTAEAFGLSGVYLAPGCADPYGSKALRAGMGAQFRLPVGFCEATLLLGGKIPVLATAARENTRSVESISGQDFIVMLGNEGNGLPESLLNAADGLIGIPMPGGAESLGVAAAAAIICYWMARTP